MRTEHLRQQARSTKHDARSKQRQQDLLSLWELLHREAFRFATSSFWAINVTAWVAGVLGDGAERRSQAGQIKPIHSSIHPSSIYLSTYIGKEAGVSESYLLPSEQLAAVVHRQKEIRYSEAYGTERVN